MEEYYGSLGSVEEFAKDGYSQDGYENILNFANWKDKWLTTSLWASETTFDIENIMTIDGFQYGSISLEDLKNMVSLMEEHSINECNFNHEIEDGCLEKVSLVVEKKTERKITQREWMVKYSEYVNLKIKKNEYLWKQCVRIGKVRDSQYRLYLELKERFEQ